MTLDDIAKERADFCRHLALVRETDWLINPSWHFSIGYMFGVVETLHKDNKITTDECFNLKVQLQGHEY